MTINITDETLKRYAEIASEAFMNDPAYIHSAKNEKIRKKVAYHGTLIRMYASRNRGFRFYFDEEGRGMLVLRPAHSELSAGEFMKCPNAYALVRLLPWAAKLMSVDSRCENKKYFDEKTYIISPVFVDVNHQRKGVASKLIAKAAEDMKALGYKIGLDTQNPDNVTAYEKMGFKVFHHVYFEDTKIHNYHMILE